MTAKLNSLKESPAYRSRAQLTHLADVTAQWPRRRPGNRGAPPTRPSRSTGVGEQLGRRRTRWHSPRPGSPAPAAELLEAAARPASTGRGADNADDGLLAERALARVTPRDEDVTVLRAALGALTEARRLRDRAEAGPGAGAAGHAMRREAAVVAAENAAIELARTELDRLPSPSWGEQHGPALDRLNRLSLGSTGRATIAVPGTLVCIAWCRS